MQTFYLFLDTQVFDSNAYDFENKHFRTIRALGESGQIHLVMPEITRREIEKHITEKAKEAHAALEKLRRSGFQKNLRVPPFDAIAKGTTEEAIRDELMGQFHDFCQIANVKHLPAKELDMAAVLDDYFAQKPPFGGGKKKTEFPDALAAQLLIKWCEQNSRKAVVVSGDGDWGAVKNERLEVFDNIAKFLDRFPDPIIANQIRGALKGSKYLAKALTRSFEDTDFSDRKHDAEIRDVSVDEMEVGDFYVTDIEEGVATVEAEVTFPFSAMVSGRTRLRSYRYDDGYGEDDLISTTVRGKKSATAILDVLFEPEDPSDIDFKVVSLSRLSPYINASILFE